jgi:hypothetical protein
MTSHDTSYEAQREANIKRNADRMSAMGVDALAAAVNDKAKKVKSMTSAKNKMQDSTARVPTRTSSRATKTVVRYTDLDDAAFERALAAGATETTTSGRVSYAPKPTPAEDASALKSVALTFADHIDRRERRDKKGKIIAPDCAARVTRHKTKGTLVFADHPEFTPTLTPAQVIAAGTWGGCYFHPKGGKQGIKGPCDITPKEFPHEWFDGLDVAHYACRRYDPQTNFFGVKSGQDQAYWEEHGWIIPQDPRGWFQWYCRFFCGRRTEDDARQISRWTGVCGAKGRWKTNLLRKIVNANARFDDARVSPVIRQTLLHWACEIREDEVLSMSKKM